VHVLPHCVQQRAQVLQQRAQMFRAALHGPGDVPDDELRVGPKLKGTGGPADKTK
jgi:hypothetical protein